MSAAGQAQPDVPQEVDALVLAELGHRFTACALRVERDGAPPWQAAWGHVGEEGALAASEASVFDLASLTKLYVATACLALAGRGALDLASPVRQIVPQFGGGPRDLVTIRHLLTHTSGLPAHLPLYRTCHGPLEILEAIYTAGLQARPGAQVTYSCLGFILLGECLRRVSGAPLDRVVAELVAGPLGVADEARYRPPPEWAQRIAPTELCAWRGRRLHGEVHDENAAAMGGVSGNAGLFGTARAVAALGRLYLHGGQADGHEIVRPDLADQAVRQQAAGQGERRGLGWQLKNLDAPHTSAGRLLAPASFGHTGFTGTSLWVDPTRGLVVAVLTNRVYYGREATDLLAFRGTLHDAVARAHDHSTRPEPLNRPRSGGMESIG